MIERLRARLGDPRASSFQLMGEDLALIGLDDLKAMVAAREAAIAPELREALFAEEAALAREAHGWLRRHNRNLLGRVRGYLALGERCQFHYPWPIVAILGIQQVLTGLHRNRLAGLAGRFWPKSERIADASDDVLRRTNRGIFADSVPTVLRALRVEALRREGKAALAEALADGHAAPLWDDESRAICREVAAGLAIDDPRERFRALSAATLTHFAREQAIFTFHMGSSKQPIPVSQVPAPVIERGKLLFKPFALPPGFDMRDHAARVEAFGRAFVTSVTRSEADYQVAVDWVRARYGAR